MDDLMKYVPEDKRKEMADAMKQGGYPGVQQKATMNTKPTVKGPLAEKTINKFRNCKKYRISPVNLRDNL